MLDSDRKENIFCRSEKTRCEFQILGPFYHGFDRVRLVYIVDGDSENLQKQTLFSKNNTGDNHNILCLKGYKTHEMKYSKRSPIPGKKVLQSTTR